MSLEQASDNLELGVQKIEIKSLDMEKLGNNDLALLVLKQLGFSVEAIEDITYENIKDTDLNKGTIAITGEKLGNKGVSLSEVLNQKGVAPDHILVIGDLKIYPNYEEILEKRNNDVHSPTVSFFDSIGNIFDRITSDSKNIRADSFVIENTATGMRYMFPKRFVEGFYYLTHHLSVERNKVKLREALEEAGTISDKTISSEIEKEFGKDAGEYHGASEYLRSISGIE